MDLSRVLCSFGLPGAEGRESPAGLDSSEWKIPEVLSLLCDQQFPGPEKIEQILSQLLKAHQGADQNRNGVFDPRTLAFRKPIEPGSKVIVAGCRDPVSRIPAGTTGERITGFVKFASALADPGAPIRLPESGGVFDADATLGIVIGKRAGRISASEAPAFVAGFTLLVDITNRQKFQEECRTNNNLLAKNYRSLSPLGPCIWIPVDGQIPRTTEVSLKLNGQVHQQFSLEELSYGIGEMVSAWSRLILAPGDVLGMGAAIARPRPGKSFQSPVPIRPGDILEVESEAIGALKVEIVNSVP